MNHSQRNKKGYIIHSVMYFVLCMMMVLGFNTEAKAETSVVKSGTIPCTEGSLSFQITRTTTDMDLVGVYVLDISGNGTPSISSDSYWNDIWGDNKGAVSTVNINGKIKLTGIAGHEMFYGFHELTTINGIKNIDTSGATDLAYMFSGCNVIESLDLSGFDTSNVETMYLMFNYCKSLKSLNISNFNTSKVTNMALMFDTCESLTSLNLSNFNTSNVEQMYSMFYNCKKLSSLNISSFNTGKVKRMDGMFQGCNSLSTVSLTNFNTSNVETMENMFRECNSLSSISLSNFNTVKVTKMDDMFYNCTKLQSITFGENFTMANLTDKNVFNNDMFRYCTSLTTIVKKGTKPVYLPNYGKYSTKQYNYMNAKWIGEDGLFYNTGSSAEVTKAQTYNLALATVLMNFHDANNGETYSENWAVDQYFINGGYSISATKLKKDNYTFVKYTDQNGNDFNNDIFYIDNRDICFKKFLTYKDEEYLTKGIDLYCQWTPTEYEIRYKDLYDGKNADSNPLTYTHEDHIVFAAPTRDGYTFLGWYKNNSTAITEIPIGSEGDILLYAHWECNHASTRLENYKAATCCEEGYSGDEYCETCNQQIGKGITTSATGKHQTTVTGAKEATCTEEGNTGNTYCTNSGKLLSSGTSIPTIAHDKNVTKNAKDASCTEEGYTGDKYCSMCDTLQESGNAVPMIAHNSDITKNNKAATCEADGYTGDKYCSMCDTIQKKGAVIPATGHTAGTPVKENITEATCVEDGSYDNVTYCTVCKEVVNSTHEVTPATGHKWNNGVITKEPTETETGIRQFTCTVCNETKDEILPIVVTCSHETTKKVNAKEATCVKDGYTGDTYCSICEAFLKEGIVIPATGHTGGKADCSHKAVCQTCNEEYGDFDTDCHNPETRNKKEAGCEDGYTGDVYCKDCDELIQSGDTIPGIGHLWDNGKITKEPTYEEDGERIYTCTVCNKEHVEVLTKLDKDCAHENTEVRNKVESTCEKEGYTGDNYCLDCENLLSAGEITKKAEHKWSDAVVVKEATYEEEGEKVCTCTICGTEKNIAIPVLVKQPATEQPPAGNTPVTGNNNQQNNNAVTTPVKVSKVSNLKVKNDKKKSVTISFKKIDNAKYQFQYSTDKKFKKSVKKKILTKNSYTVKNLKRGKTYYVRVRAYKTVDGKAVYGNWSTVKKVKIKK